MANMIGTSSTSHFVELPAVVRRLEQVKVERKQFRVWQALAAWLFGVLGILALFMLIDWMLGRARVGEVACSAGGAWPGGLSVHSISSPIRQPACGRGCRGILPAARPAAANRSSVLRCDARRRCPPLPACSSARPRDRSPIKNRSTFGRLFRGSCSSERRLGCCLTSIAGLIALVREPFAAHGRPPDVVHAGPLHHDERRARRSDLKAGEDLKLAVTLKGRPVSECPLVSPQEERRRLDSRSRWRRTQRRESTPVRSRAF